MRWQVRRRPVPAAAKEMTAVVRAGSAGRCRGPAGSDLLSQPEVQVVERVVAPMVLPSRNSAAVVGAVARLPQPGWWRFFVDRLKEPQALRTSQAAAQERLMV